MCRLCGIPKDLDEFFKDSRKPYGRGYRCKVCRTSTDWRRTFSTVAKPPARDGDPTLTVISLGAGVQSSAMLLMSNAGDLPPVDCAIFADTHWEPPAVYEYLTYLEQVSTVPIYRVSAGDLRQTCIDDGFVPIPMHYEGSGMIPRTCTNLFKIRPIHHKILELIDGDFVHHLVDQWLGISWDESQRMKDSHLLYLRHRYPLVDARITRDNCFDWLVEHGHPAPPRSSCLGCPYHSDEEWKAIKEHPDQWEDLIEVEATIRRKPGLERVTLHRRSTLPLLQLDQGGGGEECGGYCGL